MSNSGTSSAFLAPGLLASPKLRKSYSPVPTPQSARSRNQSFDGSADKTIKKSLVEEFYKKEAKSKQRSYTDISGSLSQVSLRPNGSFTQLNESDFRDDDSERAPLQEPIDEKIAHGKLQYVWNDRKVGFSENTAEKLINLDRGGSSTTLLQVDTALDEAIRASGRSHGLHTEPNTSESELGQVEKYIQQETAKVDEIHQQLMHSVMVAKGKYRTKLEASMDQVQVLRHTLEELADRVNAARERIHGCKGVLSGSMEDKLTILDHVCRQFEKYDRVHHQQRMWYLIIAGTCMAMALVAYTVMACDSR